MLTPVSQTHRGNVRHESNTLRILPARVTRIFSNRTEDVSRRMAFRAMGDALHEIAPAVPLNRMRRIPGNACRVKKEQFPHTDEAADIEWKGKLMRWWPPRDPWKRAQIGHQGAHTLQPHVRKTCVRNHWIVVSASG